MTAKRAAPQAGQNANAPSQEGPSAEPAPAAVPVSWAGDWTEDYILENGCYFNTCCKCGKPFAGYKRRVICKVCAANAPEPAGGMLDSLVIELFDAFKYEAGVLITQIARIAADVMRHELSAHRAYAEQLQARVREVEKLLDEARGAMLYRDNFTEILPKIVAALAAQGEKKEKP